MQWQIKRGFESQALDVETHADTRDLDGVGLARGICSSGLIRNDGFWPRSQLAWSESGSLVCVALGMALEAEAVSGFHTGGRNVAPVGLWGKARSG
jgi:hypothetical protein